MAKTCAGCGEPLSLVRRLASGRCPVCQAEYDRGQAEAAQAEHEARLQRERAAAAAAAEREARRRTCPTCGGTRFHRGWLPDSGGSMITGSNCVRFRPDENLISAYPLYALACLGCGHVRLFLHDADRAELAGGG